MSLDKELRTVDLTRFEDIIDRLLTRNATTTTDAMKEELNFAEQNYPALKLLLDSTIEAAPSMLNAGYSEDKIADVLVGMSIVAVALSIYASSEIPDLPPQS